jgi:hypothetical protein
MSLATPTSIEIYLSAENSVKLTEYSSHCTYRLSRPISAPIGWGLYLRCLNFTCPISWYPLNKYYSQIILNGTEHIIPDGNYSIKQLCTVLSNLVPAINFTHDPITMKVIASSDTPFSIDGSILPILGILPQFNKYMTSKFTYDLSSNNSIYVLTNLSSPTPNRDVRRVDSGSVLCRIPVGNKGMGEVLDYENYSGTDGLRLDTEVIETITIILQTEDRTELLSTLDYDLSLQVSFVPSDRERMQIDYPLQLNMPNRAKKM